MEMTEIYEGIVQVLSGTVGSVCFAMLFNIRGLRLAVASLGGFISWSLYLVFNFLTESEVFSYFLVAALITLYSEYMARVVKTPTTTFIMASLVPLIPGASLYYTMRYAFAGDFTDFGSKAVYTLELAAALALGVIIATGVAKAVFKRLGKRKAQQ